MARCKRSKPATSSLTVTTGIRTLTPFDDRSWTSSGSKKHETLGVRSGGPGSDAREDVEQMLGRMPIRVVDTDTNETDGRTHALIQFWTLVGRAVMGDFDHVEPRQCRVGREHE